MHININLCSLRVKPNNKTSASDFTKLTLLSCIRNSILQY